MSAILLVDTTDLAVVDDAEDIVMASSEILLATVDDLLNTATTPAESKSQEEDLQIPCFRWQLPSQSNAQKLLLCSAYTNAHYNEYIAPEIIILIRMFFCVESYDVREITHGAVGSRFHGPMLSICGFKFYIELYPNGTTEQHKGQAAAFFCLASLPANIQSIQLDFNFALHQVPSMDSNSLHEYTMSTYWRGIYAKTCQLIPLQSLSFNLYLRQMNIHFKPNCPIPQNLLSLYSSESTSPNPSSESLASEAMLGVELQNENATTLETSNHQVSPASLTILPGSFRLQTLDTQTFLWEVTDHASLASIRNATNVYGFASPVFMIGGIKWYLTFYPNGSKILRESFCNVYLHLAALPKRTMRVDVRHSQGLQKDVYMRDSKFITEFDHDKSSWGLIERSTYGTRDLDKLPNYLCVAEMIMLDVYDGDKVLSGWNVDEHEVADVSRLNGGGKCYFKWKLSEDELRKCVGSKSESGVFDMFGFEWRMVLYPCGKDFEQEDIVICCEMVRGMRDGLTVSVRVVFEIGKLDTRYITTGILDSEVQEIDWGRGRISTERFAMLDSCEIEASMQLVDVYDGETCVTEKFALLCNLC